MYKEKHIHKKNQSYFRITNFLHCEKLNTQDSLANKAHSTTGIKRSDAMLGHFLFSIVSEVIRGCKNINSTPHTERQMMCPFTGPWGINGPPVPWELIDHAAFSRMKKKRIERKREQGREVGKDGSEVNKKWSEDSCKKRAVADFVTPHWELTDTEPDGVFNLQISFAHLQWFIAFHTHFEKRSFFIHQT